MEENSTAGLSLLRCNLEFVATVAVILSENSVAKQNDGILQTQAGEPIEIIYYDQYTPDGISRLIKKEIYTYYPVAVFTKEE